MNTPMTSGFQALKNGLRKRCPHCGKGSLLKRFMTLRDRCEVCGYVYERNPGDTWGFWIFGDRLPIAVAIPVVYFGMGPRSWLEGGVLIAAAASVLLATIPQRIGLVVALDYLSRRKWPDPDDVMPPLPSGRS